MCYRATPTSATGISPAEMLMGRKIKTTLPSLNRNLIPKCPDRALIRCKDAEAKQQQAYYFNKRHGVRDLPLLHRGDQILLKLDEDKTWKGPVSVMQESGTQRSYQVNLPRGGVVRRNRRHLQLVPPRAVSLSSDTKKVDSELKGTETKHQTLCHTQGNSKRVTTNTPEGQVVTRFGRGCKLVIRMNM